MKEKIMSMNMDLFDLIFVSCATLFHWCVIGVYVANRKKDEKLTRIFGMTSISLSLPLIVVFGHYLISGETLWKVRLMGVIFTYMLIEFLLDFVFKYDFRSKVIPHVLYIIVFYAAIFGFIRIAFEINLVWGYVVSVSFWTLLGALIYNLSGLKKART